MTQPPAQEEGIEIEPTFSERFGAWFDVWAPRLGFMTVGALIAGPIAWWVGAWVGCSRSEYGCAYRADSVEALGTWFGAVGTVAAVLAAVYAFRSEERVRREQARKESTRQRALERRYRKEASLVTISVSPFHTVADQVLGYRVAVRNGADTSPIYGLRRHDMVGTKAEHHSLDAGKSVTEERNRSASVAFPEVPKSEFASWATPQVTIMFKMNDRTWRRVGNEGAELVDSFEYDGDMEE